MPRRPKAASPDASLAPIPDEILDQFGRQGPLTPEELDTAVRRFKKAIIERAVGAELSPHLGYVPGGTKPEDTTNHRNGSSGKTVLTDDGPLTLAVPRDRDGSFEPRLIGKHERSWPRSPPGRRARSSPCIPWSSSTRCASRFAMRPSFGARPSTWHSR